MILGDWIYYNHGWIKSCAPHEDPDLGPLESGELFKLGGILARYTTEFDCKDGTYSEWWYTIKDTVFDISSLKSKRRYVILQGDKNFDVRTIDPLNCTEEMFGILDRAYYAYPRKYRPILDKDKVIAEFKSWTNNNEEGYVVYGAYYKGSNQLAGYALMQEKPSHIDFLMQRVDPEFEKYQINAALIHKIVDDYGSKIESGKYICDGSRNILHETHFQDYLEKYFGFRKAYCKLHIVYARKYRLLVRFLYVFRKLFRKLDKIKKIHQINGVLLMEEIVRKQNKNTNKVVEANK